MKDNIVRKGDSDYGWFWLHLMKEEMQDSINNPVFVIVKKDVLSVQWASGSMKSRREGFQSMVIRFKFVLAARRCGSTPRPFAFRVTTEKWLCLDKIVEESGHIHASFKPRPKFLRTMMEYTKVAKSRAMAMTAESTMLEGAKTCGS